MYNESLRRGVTLSGRRRNSSNSSSGSSGSNISKHEENLNDLHPHAHHLDSNRTIKITNGGSSSVGQGHLIEEDDDDDDGHNDKSGNTTRETASTSTTPVAAGPATGSNNTVDHFATYAHHNQHHQQHEQQLRVRETATKINM
jgi:hypothetical protein